MDHRILLRKLAAMNITKVSGNGYEASWRIEISRQRRRNEFKVGGAEHTSADGASSVEGSGGILPREILKTRTPEMPFPAIWALNLEFIFIAKMS